MDKCNLNKKIITLPKKQIFLCVAGTVLEWYDFALFACLTPILVKVFFPTENYIVALLNTFMIFAVGFIVRPLGAVIFGHMGDRIGRKKTLFSTIILMTLATTGIGLIPIHVTDSISLSVIFIILRIIQGLAASGEYPGGITMLAELAPSSRKGLIASLGIFSAIMGAMFGSLISTSVSLLTTQEQMQSWGWRIPFLLGMPLGVIGLLFRYKVNESTSFVIAKENKNLSQVPLFDVVKNNFSKFITTTSLYILATVGFYINFVYLTNYLVTLGNISTRDALGINFLCNFIYVIFIPIAGYFSDLYDRKMIMHCASLIITLSAYPLFYIIFNCEKPYIVAGQAFLAFLMAIFLGPLAAFSAENFATNIRYSGIALALNLPNAIFGGLTPVICTLLVSTTNNVMSSAYYLMASSLIAFMAISTSKKPKVNLSKLDQFIQSGS